MNINKVMISGNLTRDPELRETSGGMAVLKFGVAVNDRRRNQQTGEWEDYPNYIDCTMFGNRATNVSKFISKGSKVAIEGKLRFSSWEKDGMRRSKLEVIVDELEFMSKNNGSAGGNGAGGGAGYGNNGGYNDSSFGGSDQYSSGFSGGAQASSADAPAPTPSVDITSGAYEDEIPF